MVIENKNIYKLAKIFLLNKLSTEKNPEEILNSYLSVPKYSLPTSALPLSSYYIRLLDSAQNTNMKPKVIGGAIGGVSNLGKVLFGFEPMQVIDFFKEDSNKLLDTIVETLNPSGKINKDKIGLWPKYCKTILSAANFLNQFEDGQSFYDWLHQLYDDPRTRAALPMIISQEIYGLGYALSCDFLKELGLSDYGKPDVHIKKILTGLQLCEKGSTDYQFQKALQKIAKETDVTTYAVDKVLWLIGSGNFYNHKNIIIGHNVNDFLTWYSKQI